jgi:hypothetical protein
MSSRWFNVTPLAYMSFPFHVSISPSTDEVNKLLQKNGLLARYTCPAGSGAAGYYTACSDKSYDLSRLTVKARNQSRRGLERCAVRRVSFAELHSLGGIAIDRDTLLRQGRPVSRRHDAYWKKYYSTAADTTTMEAWAALVSNKLAAFIICCSFNDCMTILSSASNRSHLKAYPNNALIYTFTKDALSRPHISQVSYGLAPLQPGLENLDHFKHGMGFANVPVGQRIHFHPRAKPFLAKPALRLLRRGLEGVGFNGRMGQLAGILQCYADQDEPGVTSSNERPRLIDQ